MRLDIRIPACGVVLLFAVVLAVWAADAFRARAPASEEFGGVVLGPGEGTSQGAAVDHDARAGLTPISTLDRPERNPFQSAHLMEIKRKQERQRAERTEGQDRKPPGVAQPVPEEQEEPQPDPPRRIRLRYRGMMIMTDASRVALVENVTAKSAAYIRAGESIDVFELAGIDRTRLVLKGPDGKTWTLPLGTARTFRETEDGIAE